MVRITATVYFIKVVITTSPPWMIDTGCSLKLIFCICAPHDI